jgi:hypothetical protein
MGFNTKGALSGAASGASAGSAFGPYGAAIGGVAGGLAGGFMGGGGGSSTPTYPSFAELAGQALSYAPKFTQANIDLQNQVTPGSSTQRQVALNQLNSYIQGQVPLDVQQNTQRAIAQSVGGGYNPFTGGGQAPSAFARNIGQTSVGLSQYGLSAAPTWQQLANSMVASPASLLAPVMGTAENQYTSQLGQFSAQQAQAQNNASLLNAGLGNIANIYGSQDKSGYLSTISRFGGLPATGYGAYAQQGGGYYQPGTTVFY